MIRFLRYSLLQNDIQLALKNKTPINYIISATNNLIPINMYSYTIIAQLIIAISVCYIWIFRFDNIVLEFKQYLLPDVVRNMVGASKIALSTLLVAGIWYPELVCVPALLMAFLMLSAQYFHFKVKNPWAKHFPSLVLLLLSLFVAASVSKLF